MSVQSHTPADLPLFVAIDPFDTGDPVIGTVVSHTAEADTCGIGDVLTVDVDGSRFRVDASEADLVD